ncbi:MAG: transcriptional regulator [Rubrivivax sp. SCN 71-131]|nr:MAG: transcriptional regulator [Rubrivivax sp. SCN 71-131]
MTTGRHESAPRALGIDLGGSKIEALLLDAENREHWRERVPTPGAGYDAILDAIVALVRRAEDASALPFTLGLGTPGSLTPEGLLKNSNTTCLNGRALQRDLQERLQTPLVIANDANCLALSEATDGAGAGAEVVFAAILGTGVGAGIAVHGRVLRGVNGLAGEWGHNPLPWAVVGEDPAPSCYCGQAGCIETLLSGPALARDHEAHTGRRLGAEAIAAAAGAGDVASQATLERHASRLARALAGVINLLDPDVIVLGGGLSRIAQLYERVPALWSRWVFSGGHRDPVRTRLLPARHGDASGVRGAAWIGRRYGAARALDARLEGPESGAVTPAG